MSPRTGPRRRLGSIRLSLILLALVPSVTLAAIWSVTTIQMFCGRWSAIFASDTRKTIASCGRSRLLL